MARPQASDELIFYVNGKKIVEKNADPEDLLLSYLRKKLRLTGTKYGCGGGGCGACTVMVSTIHPISKKIRHYPATACLLPICSLHGMAVTTTEGIGNSATRLHPVQERLAKAHGSQCGFCSPGMVMSMYTLLRNKPEPSIEDILSSMSGNLCRCTGYRPIIDAFRTFNKDCCLNKIPGGNLLPEKDCCLNKGLEEKMLPKGSSLTLFDEKEFLPLDPTQELIFPPELMMMWNNPKKMTTFYGERTTWYSPSTLEELLKLKMKFPNAPLVIGNTTVGIQMKFEGVLHPVLISPVRISDLFAVSTTNQGINIGAAVSLAQVQQILKENVSKLPQDKTKISHALLQQLSTLAGEQVRSMACLGGHVMSKSSASDLNPVLAAGGAVLNLASKVLEIQANDCAGRIMPGDGCKQKEAFLQSSLYS